MDEQIHKQMRRRRRELGLTQVEAARRVGCKQSAISMFESGHDGALSGKHIRRLADVLGIDGFFDDDAPGVPEELVLSYCPSDTCPSNIPYVAGGELCFKPAMVRGSRGKSHRCRWCGEVLVSECPTVDCESAVVEGGFCQDCGAAYVTATVQVAGWQAASWASQRRAEIREIREMSRTATAAGA